MMHTEQAIADLEKRLNELKAEEQKVISAINCLCDVTGQPRKYEETTAEQHQNSQTRPDQYYGRPLATVTAEVLEKRKEAGIGAATLDQLFTELSRGGFKFEGKNDGIQKRGLAISMSKNPKFHRLPNDTWGLTEWYPNKAKEDKGKEAEAEEIKKAVKDAADGIRGKS